MYEAFQEIAFQAEVSTYEDPDFEELALELCNEKPELRPIAIDELRQTIYERGGCTPHRMDDAFLLRFLRARRFVVAHAYRLMVRYYKFRDEYPHLYRNVELFGLARVGGAYEGVFADDPRVGRITILRFGVWEPSEVPVEDVVRSGMLLLEIGTRQPKLQVLGGVCLVDMAGIGLKHMSTLTPAIAYQIVSLIGTSLPSRVRSCHLINYSWYFNAFSYLFQKIIPNYAWKHIHFHGKDMTSLHAHIPPESLPPRYGGTCKNYATFEHWLNKVKKYRDQDFDDEMRALGYLIKE